MQVIMYLISDEAVEEDMIDLAQALYAAGVRPEPLFSISEENLCREEPEPQIVLSDEDTASASGLHDDIVVDLDEDANKVCICAKYFQKSEMQSGQDNLKKSRQTTGEIK